MRFFAIFLFLTLSIQADMYSQTELKDARIDLAVPDAPAFKIMGVDPTEIMRPGTFREIAVTATDFILNNDLLPESFGVEVAPVILADPSLSLSDYRTNYWKRFKYRFRTSFATNKDDEGRDIAFGLRFTLIDDTDLRMDPLFKEALIAVSNPGLDALNDIIPEISSDPLQEKVKAAYTKYRSTKSQEDLLALREVIQEIEDEDLKAHALILLPGSVTESIDEAIDRIREEAKDRLWNQDILELGIASLIRSTDTGSEALYQDKIGIWGSWGFPVYQSGGGIVGVKALTERDERLEWKDYEFSLAGRFYIGDNSSKIFIEPGGTSIIDMRPNWSLQFGGELNLINGIWIDLSFGSKWVVGYKPETISNFNVRFATPE